jgi:hypothetical protein
MKARPNQRLLDADGSPCPYCHGTMDRGNVKLHPTSDHIRAKSRFKRQPKTNGRTIIVCSECNFMKGTLTLEEFIFSLIEKNRHLLRLVDNNLSRMNNIRYLLDIGLDKE